MRYESKAATQTKSASIYWSASKYSTKRCPKFGVRSASDTFIQVVFIRRVHTLGHHIHYLPV